MLDATPVILYTVLMTGWAVAMVWLFRYLKNRKKKDDDGEDDDVWYSYNWMFTIKQKGGDWDV